jgi:hypothetical protein
MAKIKFGMMMTDARGKLGGQVFSKNKGGAYVRTKVTPTNPQTTAQSTVRALFGVISQGWSALTSTARTSWRTAVDSWKTTDVFGDLLAPTGKELYQRLNNQAQTVGYSAIATPPIKVVLPDDIVTAIAIDTTASTLTMTGNSTSASIRISIFGTAPLSQGTKFVKNRLRQIIAPVGNADSPSDDYSAYVAKFGLPVAGDNIVIGVKYVAATGQATPMQTIKAVVSA